MRMKNVKWSSDKQDRKQVFQAMRSDPKQINVKTGQGNKVTYDPSKM